MLLLSKVITELIVADFEINDKQRTPGLLSLRACFDNYFIIIIFICFVEGSIELEIY